MTASERSDPRAPRRRWPLAEKQRIVERTLQEGASLRAIARDEGVHPTSLSHWRAKYRGGELASSTRARRARTSDARLVPVTIAPSPASRHSSSDSDARSVLQLVFSSGTSLRIECEALDASLVCALIAQVKR